MLLSKGDKVFVFSRKTDISKIKHIEDVIEEWTITSVGKKYVYAAINVSTIFPIAFLYDKDVIPDKSFDFLSDYNKKYGNGKSYFLFKSKQDFIDYLQYIKEKRTVECFFASCSGSLTKNQYKIIYNIIAENNDIKGYVPGNWI